jgi:hypothetical protein
MEGHLYSNRSFVIRNDSSVALDFSLSTVFRDAPRRARGVGEAAGLVRHGLALAGSESEVSLSSSQYVLKLVRTLTLPPQVRDTLHPLRMYRSSAP